MLDFPSTSSKSPDKLHTKTAQTLRKKAASDDMVIVFNIHLGELQQFRIQFV